MREGFTLMLGAASWAFEKGDQLVGTWMEQGQATREEGRRKFEEFAARTRKGGEELGRKVSERVRDATSSMPVATREQVQNLERRVEELTRQLELLRRGAGPEGESKPGSSSAGRQSRQG
jgi:polyhydroxyalkanoate synthesis regulator phasin